MPAPTEDEGVENAAILLMSLGEEEAAEVFKHLSPKEVQKLGETIAKLKAVSRERVEQVIDAFDVVAANEHSLVNDTDGVLALSREAGAFEELQGAALAINPFDVAATADVLHEALAMPAAERSRRAAALKVAAGRRQAVDWLDDLLAAARS